jgi:hypothetical protein
VAKSDLYTFSTTGHGGIHGYLDMLTGRFQVDGDPTAVAAYAGLAHNAVRRVFTCIPDFDESLPPLQPLLAATPATQRPDWDVPPPPPEPVEGVDYEAEWVVGVSLPVQFPAWFPRWLKRWLLRTHVTPRCRTFGRRVGERTDNYLSRWTLLQLFGLQLCLHYFHRGDADEYPHDHPWSFWTLILSGGYFEILHRPRQVGNRYVFVEKAAVHRPGTVLFRPAHWPHRVLMHKTRPPVWTLIVTGPVKRRWGFQTLFGWVHWKRYLSDKGIPYKQ